MTTGTNNFLPFIVKIILIQLALAFLTLVAAKTQSLTHLSFNSTLQLISYLSSGLQKLLRYFNGAGIVAFFRIPLIWFGAGWSSVSPTNSVLFTEDWKAALSPISAIKLVLSFFE